MTTQPQEISIIPNRNSEGREQLSTSQTQHEDDMAMLHQQMEEQGYTLTYMDDLRKVKDYTRQTLFCKLKFINSHFDLYRHGKGTLSSYVMDALNINPSFRQDFWHKQAPNLKRALNQRRANCSSDIGKIFIGKRSDTYYSLCGFDNHTKPLRMMSMWHRKLCQKKKKSEQRTTRRRYRKQQGVHTKSCIYFQNAQKEKSFLLLLRQLFTYCGREM